MSADLVDNFEYVGMKAARGFPEKNIPVAFQVIYFLDNP
ncbi:Uncharacterized protein dnm_080110 [Desulfonema magnum]|uniref:Uncharacterized protein n=1 Tax=Desulfonema magnum TaxID=45655 RepID=A0A975BV98_9BACT|nr:Uncharacterized protein dnm_080110 [Desulfonema magnum]